MVKGLSFAFLLLLFNSLASIHALSQSPASQSSSSALSKPTASLLPPSQYGMRWQRLLLQLSSTYFTVVKENQVDLDSSLLYTSHSLGLSRLPLIAEGFDEEALLSNSTWIDHRDPAAALRLLPTLKGIAHLRLLVLLGSYYAFQPDNHHAHKDSATSLLSEAREESRNLHDLKWGRQALCLLGKIAVERNDLAGGGALFNQLISECRASDDIENEAKAWSYQGLYTAYSPGTTGDRIASLEKARALYGQKKEFAGEINTLMNIGYLLISKLQFEKAEGIFRRALELEDSIDFPYTHYTTEAIAMVTTFEGKYGEPLKYALQSVKTSEATSDSIGWAYFYSRLGVLYNFKEDRKAESLKWMQKSMDRFLRTGGDPSLYRNLANIIGLQLDLGQPAEALAQAQRVAKLYPPAGPVDRLSYNLVLGECYQILKQYGLSEKYYLEAGKMEKLAESMRGSYNRPFINAKIGAFYFVAGQYSKAQAYFQRFLSDPARGAMPLGTTMSVQKRMFTIDSASGRYIPAIRRLEQYLRLIDSNFSVSQRRQVEELGIQYETEKKENDIRLKDQHIQSLMQADQIRQASFDQANFVQKITIAGIVLLFVIGALLYKQNRQKQSSNRVVTEKNKQLQHLLTEKEWLLKEVHHRVKNNLHTVNCLLDSQACYLENDALKAIQKSQQRIYAMSMIHQKIYQSDDIRTINMANYLPEFIGYLRDSFGAPANIQFQLEVEPLELGVAHAVPVALIVNEAVNNSIKYAFTASKGGQIMIALRQIGRQVKLSIADNGIGIRSEFMDGDADSLGMQLMKGLSREMKGEITIETGNGTRITILFDPASLDEFQPLNIPTRETTTTV